MQLQLYMPVYSWTFPAAKRLPWLLMLAFTLRHVACNGAESVNTRPLKKIGRLLIVLLVCHIVKVYTVTSLAATTYAHVAAAAMTVYTVGKHAAKQCGCWS